MNLHNMVSEAYNGLTIIYFLIIYKISWCLACVNVKEYVQDEGYL